MGPEVRASRRPPAFRLARQPSRDSEGCLEHEDARPTSGARRHAGDVEPDLHPITITFWHGRVLPNPLDQQDNRGKMIVAGRAYLLADHTKFTRRTPFRVPNMDKCAGVIVDRMPDRMLAAAWATWGWDIIIAK